MSFIKETLLLLLVTLLLLVPLPVKYSWFELKEGQKPDVKPPGEECRQICLGTSEDKSCGSFSKKYLQCKANCYGLLYDGCLGWEGSLGKKTRLRTNSLDSVLLDTLDALEDPIGECSRDKAGAP